MKRVRHISILYRIILAAIGVGISHWSCLGTLLTHQTTSGIVQVSTNSLISSIKINLIGNLSSHIKQVTAWLSVESWSNSR